MKKLKRVLIYTSPFHSHGVPLDLAVGAVDKLSLISNALTTSGVCVDVLTSDTAARAMRSRRAEVFDACNVVHAVPEKIFSDIGGGVMERAARVFDGAEISLQDNIAVTRAFEQQGVKDNYDIVISFFSETVFLKQIFKSAHVLFFETGLVCHQPFQQFHSFDPYGSLTNGSYIGRTDPSYLIEQEDNLEEYRPILEKIRHGIGAFSAQNYQSLTDLHGLRAKWKHIYLVVGQPMGRAPDGAIFPSTFALVEHVLNSVPGDSGVLLTEHPSFPQLTAVQHRYLENKYPNYVFSAALQAIYSASSICLPLADAVVGISSTVLLHAHALGVKTFSLGDSCFAMLNNTANFSAFVTSVEDDEPTSSKDLEILDLIAHYSVPLALYQTPWLAGHLERVINTSGGRLPRVASAEVLSPHYDQKALPKSIVKPVDFYQRQWHAAPLSLAEPWAIEPVGSTYSKGRRKAKRTIATILDHYAIGGTQNVIRRLVKLLPDVHWVIFVERRVPEEYAQLANCEIIEIGSIGDTEHEPERKLARAVYNFNKQCPIDVFINPMHWRPATLKAMPLIKQIADIPVVYWEHNSFFFPMYTAKPYLHDLRAEVVEKVDRVVLLSDYDRWHFSSHYPNSRHQVIFNPVPEVEMTQALSLNKEKSVLIVGRFDPQKRMDRIPAIAEAFLSAHHDWSFKVLGDGYMRESVEAAVAKTAVADRVHFLGHQADPTPHFQMSAIFASLSDYEGDPLTFLEAKSAGLPIVSFELFQNTKLRDGVDGFYLQQGDTEGFAEKLSFLASNPKQRHAMAIEGHKHFLCFNNEGVAESWSNLFDALIEGAPFDPLPVEAPPSVTLHREAVHVAKSVHNLMNERIRQVRDRAAIASNSTTTEAPKRVVVSEKKPTLNMTHVLRQAQNHMRNGAFDKAAELYEKCTLHKPDSANLKRFLAEALLCLGRRRAALEQLKLALELKPGNRNLKRRIQKISAPKLYFWIIDQPFTG